MKISSNKGSFLLFAILSRLQTLSAEQNVDENGNAYDVSAEDDANQTTTDNNDEWLEGFIAIAPYLCALFLLIFLLHLLIQPDWMMISLMRQYLDEGSPVVGSVLDCQDKPNQPGSYLVEVSYATHEHKYADNPSMRFRNPGAYDVKNFVRRYEFHRALMVGDAVPVLLPRGSLFPRSGCPREVVEQTLHSLHEKRTQRYAVLGGGLTIGAIVVGLAMWKIVHMDHPAGGWSALVCSLAVFEVVSFLFCGDQFMKKKRRTFDAARPMVNAAQQKDRLERKANDDRKTVQPFSIPLNEFAGHARATERNR